MLLHKHLLSCTRCIFTDECKMCFLFVLSRISIFPRSEWEKTLLTGSQRELAHNRGLPIAGNQPSSVDEKMLHTQYRGWWLCVAIHMAKVQYCMCLTNMLQTVWTLLSGKRSTFWSPHPSWRVLLCYIPHFDQVIRPNSRLRRLCTLRVCMQ